MSEAELLQVWRGTRDALNTDFAQIIAITFAMVIGTYYFLGRARLRLKLFAYLSYSIGMFFYLGMMMTESNVLIGALEGMRAIPPATLSRPAAHAISVSDSWVALLTSGMINVGFWALWLGVGWMVFFWKREPGHPPD